jgi:hypothetical protein
VKYVPEFNKLLQLAGKFVMIDKNPWVSLLALPIQERGFFAGVLAEMESCGSQWSAETSVTFEKPITLKHVLAYAKKVNELPKVRQYMDAYSELR